jgi:hypothetical protein
MQHQNPRSRDQKSRLREFVRIDRAATSDPAKSAVVRQDRAPRAARLREFLRIDRGHRA